MISNKPKKCKGINKAKNFDGCGVMTKYRKYGLCKNCYTKFLTSTKEGEIIIQKSILKASKPREQLNRAKINHRSKTSLKSLEKQVSTTVHRYIRLRDMYKPCVSCGAKWDDSFQAGHFYKSETHSLIKYHENNIHGQCRKCNLHFDGNFDNYKIGVKERISDKDLIALDKLSIASKRSVHKWTRPDLLRIRDHYNKKIKELLR